MGKVWKKLKKVRLRSLIILVILLLFNVYAWFIFISKVSTTMSVHVSSWNILFKTEDEVITNHVTINVEKACPGMQDFAQKVTVINNGESEAYLTYNMTSLKIFDMSYIISEEEPTALTDAQKNTLAETGLLPSGTYTEEQIKDMLDDLPFSISIDVGSFEDVGTTREATYTIRMEWPYESGDDNTDTAWGQKAYNFYNKNPSETSAIEIGLILEAKQKTPEADTGS